MNKELEDFEKGIKEFFKEGLPDYEIHLFHKGNLSDKKIEKTLPFHDFSSKINKSDAWIVWLSDENQYITDLQVYDFQLESGPYRRQKIVEYVDYEMKKTPYRDCGCVNSDWSDWRLIDIYFKLGIQYAFRDRNIMVKCLKRLACINEFREEITGHLRFLE